MAASRPSARARAAATALGAGAVLALAGLDAWWGSEHVISATVVIGPFLVAWLAPEARPVTAVALLAVTACVVSGVWDDNFGDVDHIVRVLVTVASEHRRFGLLSAAAAIGEEREGVDEAADKVRELAVPELADACEVRLGPADEARAAAAAGPDAIVLPLRARGTEIGTLALRREDPARRPFTSDDADFARVFAGRAALALDNAGLFSTVESLQARLTAALGSLDEAVTIQDRDGRLIYANDAAARALGYATPAALVQTPPQEIADGFVSVREDGTPVGLDDLPGRLVLAGESPEPLLVRAVHRETGEERWRVIRATAIRDREGQALMAVNVIEDVTDVKRAELAQRFLAEAGALLASSLDHEQTLQQVAWLAVPQLADWCGVSLPDEQGYLRTVAVAHADPEKVRLAREYNRRFAARVGDADGSAQVLRDGASQLVNDIPDELLTESVSDPEQLEILRELGLRAVMVVPMIAARRVIGVMSFVSAESGRRFSEADLELAEELGRRAGTAVDNARLYTERSFIARTLQTSLLPDALPEMPGFEIASLYRPAGEENLVGGDFYDAFETPAGWMIVVGDVTGRGAEAAALTAQARHTVRTAGTLLGDPLAAIDQLNRALAARRDLPICTVAVALLDVRGGRAVAHVACAGHPCPFRVRAGEAVEVGAGGPMVGAWPDSVWRTEEVPLEPGDLLVLFTDGVIDACGRDDRFGTDRLGDVLREAAGAGAQDVVGRVHAALQAFERGAQADDTAIVAIRRLATPPG